MCLMPYANNKGAVSLCTRSLISTFIVLYLDSIIYVLTKSEMSGFLLVSVAEQAGLNLTWSKISEETLSRDVALFIYWYQSVTLSFSAYHPRFSRNMVPRSNGSPRKCDTDPRSHLSLCYLTLCHKDSSLNLTDNKPKKRK